MTDEEAEACSHGGALHRREGPCDGCSTAESHIMQVLTAMSHMTAGGARGPCDLRSVRRSGQRSGSASGAQGPQGTAPLCLCRQRPPQIQGDDPNVTAASHAAGQGTRLS